MHKSSILKLITKHYIYALTSLHKKATKQPFTVNGEKDDLIAFKSLFYMLCYWLGDIYKYVIQNVIANSRIEAKVN